MADTAALVVALSAQLTKFEKDMRAAGIMAERAVSDIEGKFSKMSPKISTSFFGNLFAQFAGQAVAAGIEAIKGLADQFIELQKVAAYTEVSIQWLYGLQTAGAKAGAAVGDINTAVKALAFSLDEMKRGGDNALKTLLDANPQFLKGVNRDALTVQQTLKIVAEIIASAKNNIQAFDMAKNLGIPESAINLLKLGGDEVERLAAEAAKAGPNIKQMAEQAAALRRVWDGFLESLQTSIVDNFFSAFKSAVAGIIAILERFSNSQEGTTIMGRAADQALDAWREVGKELDKVGEKPKKIIITGGTTSTDPFARKTGGVAAGRDEFERANDSITKHIALMNADTAAVGKGVYEQERLKTEATLMEGVRRKLNIAEGEAIPLNEELAAKIKKQADASGEAALKNAEVKEQLNKLNQASQILGSAISTAFSDAVVEGKKLTEVLDALLKTLAKAAINASIMNLFTPGAGGINPFLSFLGLQGKMAGGPVNAGQPYLVGERGPELMVPGQNGMVIPNGVLGRGGNDGATVQNNFVVSGDVSQQTIDRLQRAVMAAHQKADSVVKTIVSTQRLQATGVR